MTPKRFLLLYSDTGGGHRAGAQAVAQALHARYGDAVQVELVDALVYSRKWPFHRFPAWYPAMLRGRAIPWQIGFRLTDHRSMADALTRAVYPYVRPALRALFREHPADGVVSFHALLNRLLGLGMAETPRGMATATVVLDMLSAHALWYGRGLDRYFLPWEEMRARAQALGVRREQIRVVGLPVRREMVEAAGMTKAQARAALGLPANMPLVLITGGGEGMGPMVAVVRALLARKPRAQIAAIAGRNPRLQAQLLALARDHPLRVEGFTEQMHLWLRAADILVTKAGPNTLAEAFVMGLPLILYTAIPGQEEGNVRLVQARKAGLWTPRAGQAADAVMALLGDEARRKDMGRRSEELAAPHAADLIARELFMLVSN